MSNEYKIESVTVSAEEKDHATGSRGTFISWTAKPQAGESWTKEEAHLVTSVLNEELTVHAMSAQLAKGAITVEEYNTRRAGFKKRYKTLLEKYYGHNLDEPGGSDS